MLGDLTSTAAAFVLFPLFVVVPGFVIGRLTGAAAFREQSLPWQILLAALFSIAVCPILTYLLARTGSFFPVWAAYGLIWLLFLGLATEIGLARAGRAAAGVLRRRWAICAILLWLVIGYLMLADIELDGGLSLSMLVHDYLKHVAITDAISRTGVPPANPSLYPGAPLDLFYYYLWFLLCSLVDRLGGSLIGPIQAVHAGALWTGLILMATLFVFVRHMAIGGGKTLIPPRYGLALFLLLVTGLDILPLAALGFLHAWAGSGPGIPADLQWWNEQISAWTGAMLWVPHHIAALVACLTGFLVLRHLAARPWRLRDLPAAAVAGLAFASAAGMSVWVTLVAAACFALWCGFVLAAGRRNEILPHLVAGAVALVAAFPFLLDLAGAHRLDLAPLRFAVREFWPLTKSLQWFGAGVDCGAGCLLLLLPVNYALELGFFLLAVPYYWRARLKRGKLTADELLFLTLTGVSVLICTFLRADIYNNDLAWRGFMFAQFFMLLWSLPVAAAVLSPLLKGGAARPPPSETGNGLPWTAPGRAGRTILAAAIVLGLLATTAEMLRLRLRPAEEQVLALRRIYEWIDENTPRTAVVQHNPGRKVDLFHALYGHRQTAVSDELYGILYGVGGELFDTVHVPVLGIFQASADLPRVLGVCERFGIDFLVVKATDPIWDDPSAWASSAVPIHENTYARVFSVKDLRGNGEREGGRRK